MGYLLDMGTILAGGLNLLFCFESAILEKLQHRLKLACFNRRK
jgi:hypothetical protein